MATKKPETKQTKPLPKRPRPLGKTWSFLKAGTKKTGAKGTSKYIVAGGPRKYPKKKNIEDTAGKIVTTERAIRKGKTRGKTLKKPTLEIGITGEKKAIAPPRTKSKPKDPPPKKPKTVYGKIAEKTMTGAPSDMPLVMPKKGARSKDEAMIHDPMKMTKKRRRILKRQKLA